MNKEDLKDFLLWLSEEDVARWYSIEEDYGGEGEDNIVERYLKEKEDEETL